MSKELRPEQSDFSFGLEFAEELQLLDKKLKSTDANNTVNLALDGLIETCETAESDTFLSDTLDDFSAN